MGRRLTDAEVVAILRPFVRATAPILDALRESDPLGLQARAAQAAARGEELAEIAKVEPAMRRVLLNGLSSVKVPGTPKWQRLTPDQRVKWWIGRVGRLTCLVTAVPGIGGALADRLPVQDTLGAASQGLLLCAIAGERGVTDYGDRVRLIAWVLFGRSIDPRVAAGDVADEDAKAAELTAKLDSEPGKRVSIIGFAKTLWRLGQSLRAFGDELDKRPHGKLWQRALGLFPLFVGMFADYVAERSALKKCAKRANRWFDVQAAAGAAR